MTPSPVFSPRHKDALRFHSVRLFSGITCFAELEKRISELPTPQARGTAFEVFAEAYLFTQRVPQAKDVWPIGSEPLNIRDTLVLPTSDKGIDGLILAEDGEFTAYQVKFRHDRKAIVWDDLGNFFGLSDRVQRRLVFTNATDVNDTASARAGFMAVRGGDLDELTASDFANIEAWFDGLEAVRQIATPDRRFTSCRNERPIQELCYATAKIGPVIEPSLSVNSFLPEAVISSRSFARVMPT